MSPRVALLTQGHLGCSLLVLVDDAGASWEGGHARLMGKGWTFSGGVLETEIVRTHLPASFPHISGVSVILSWYS